MSNIKYIVKLALINVVKKKKRTYLSVFSILLSTAIVYTSLILFLNIAFFSNKTNYSKVGNYHYAISMTEPIELSSRYTITKDSDTGVTGFYNDSIVNLRVLDTGEDTQEILPFSIVEGRLPENNQEILISNRFTHQINDSIALNLDSRIVDYKVVGIYDSSSTFEKDVVWLYTKDKASDSCIYYIKDTEVHLSSSVSTLADKLNVNIESIYLNQEVITIDTMKNYMQDTTLILIVFVLIMGIAIAMSLISLYNVILVNDLARKKEIGILKSAGASPKQIKLLLQTELCALGILGAFGGLILGIVISYAVLNSFVDKIYVTMNTSMYLKPAVIIISFVLGCMLMYFSGMKAYKKYITSRPIEDLKDTPLEYTNSQRKKQKENNGASWELFLIYNERMRGQTKNIKLSFMLLVISMVLFSSIALSNAVYKNTYYDVTYDFLIQNKTTDVEGYTDLDFDFAYLLYDEKEKENSLIQSVYTNRRGLTGYLTKPELYLEFEEMFTEYIQFYQQKMQFKNDLTGTEWCDLYYIDTVLDQRQLEMIKNYASQFAKGDWTGLKGDLNQDYIMIVSNKMGFIPMYSNIGKDIEAGKIVNIGTYSLENGFNIANRDIVSENQQVKGVIYLAINDDFKQNDLYFPLENTQQIIAKIGNDTGTKDFYGIESFEITLKNRALGSQFQERLDEIIIQTNTQNMYEYINVASTIETMKFATFLIEVLFYPLFLMLLMISLLNLFNVFLGNIHLKKKDIVIFKLVGIKNNQVFKMFIFEYLEGYINSAAIVSMLFALVTFFEKKIGYVSALKLGENIIGTLICSVFVIGPLFILPMVLLTKYQITKIKVNDYSRDME